MKQKSLYLRLQRGDGGTLYIVFIMGIIILASTAMTGGLSLEFEEPIAAQVTQGDDGFGGLPPLPEKGTEEWKQGRDCAKEVDKKYTNDQIKKKGQVKVKC